MSAASTITCHRCGLGSIENVDSRLERRALQKPGFRARLVYVHGNQGVCNTVIHQRDLMLARYEKEYHSLRRRILRLARRARAWL